MCNHRFLELFAKLYRRYDDRLIAKSGGRVSLLLERISLKFEKRICIVEAVHRSRARISSRERINENAEENGEHTKHLDFH